MNAFNFLRSISFGIALAAAGFVFGNSATTAQVATPVSIESETVVVTDALIAIPREESPLRSLDFGGQTPKNPTAFTSELTGLSIQEPGSISYLYAVSPAFGEEIPVNTTMWETRSEGIYLLQVRRTGGSGTCAGSTIAE